MFEIAFRSGKDGELLKGVRPEYNQEMIILRKTGFYGKIHQGKIGSSFSSFLSAEWEKHPFMEIDPDTTEEVSEESFLFEHFKEYIDLCIENSEFYTLSCLMFLVDMLGLEIPAMHYRMQKKKESENRDVSDDAPRGLSSLEAALQGFLSHGTEIYDIPFTVYSGDTIEDACIASLHFMIGHGIPIRKCHNCGKYFIAYNRSDAIYCDRPSPYNTSRTCKEDGPLRTYSASVSGDELKRQIRNVTTARRMRVRRNPDNLKMQEELTEWLSELKKWKQQYKQGKVSQAAFKKWLEETKRYVEDIDWL